MTLFQPFSLAPLRRKSVAPLCRSLTLCIECGACGRICPEEAIADASGSICRPLKKSQWPKPQFDLTACVACVETCPTGSIGLGGPVLPGNPHNYPRLQNAKTCIGCGFCAADCPVEAIVMAPSLNGEAR